MKRLSEYELLRNIRDRIFYPLYLRRNRQIFSGLSKQSNEDSKIVLFLTVRTFVGSPQTYLEATIAHALESAGLRVLMLYCDGVLRSCDADTHIDPKRNQSFCKRCMKSRAPLLESLCLEYCSYRNILTSDRLKEIEASVYSPQKSFQELRNMIVHGVRVGEHAATSVVRYFLTHSFDENDPGHIRIFRDKLYNSWISVELADELFSRYGSRIEHIITVHGVYATWGTFYDYFRSRRVDSIVYALGIIHPGSTAFLRNGREWEMFYPDTWNKLRDRNLSVSELRKVDEYISNRFFNNSGIDISLYNKVATGEKKNVLEYLNRGRYRNRYIFYTHMIWDSVLENQSPAFRDFTDMFDKTVEYFLENTDKQLIIKIHPAELVWEKGSYSMLDYIATHFPKLTPNIFILPPSTPVNSYEIVNEHTIGLTYMGSIGYELSVIGVPVLVGGSINYRDEGGVGVPIDSVEQYYELLDDPGPAFEITKKNLQLAKKWCFYFYYLLHFDLPVLGHQYGEINWEQMKQLGPMLMDEGSALRRICRKIIEKKDIINDDNSITN